jgi:hypothetical protein
MSTSADFSSLPPFLLISLARNSGITVKESVSEGKVSTVINNKMSKEYCSGKYLGARTGKVFRF